MKSVLDQFREEDRAREEWARKRDEEAEATERMFNGLEFGSEDFAPKIDWLVEGFLPQGYLAIIAAEPKDGKTSLATAIALAVATGTDFAGRKTTQGGVLWLSLEENETERRQILQHAPDWMREKETDFPIAETERAAIRRQRCPDLKVNRVPIYTTHEQCHIDNPAHLARLAYWVAWTNAKLIVVDPLAAAHSRGSLSDAYAARRALKLLKQFCTDHGVTAIVLHHLGNRGKSRRVAESPQLSATASMIMLLSRLEMPPLADDCAGGGGQGGGSISPSSCARPEPHNDVETRPAEELSSAGVPPADRSHKPQTTRHIALVCRGRGDFANQTVHLRSENPLHYEPYTPVEEPKPKAKRGRPSTTERKILNALAEKAPQSKMDLIDSTGERPGTVKNAVARLFDRGAIRNGGIRQGARVYFLDRTRTKKERVSGFQRFK